MATTKPDSGVAARHEGTVESVYAGDSGVDRLKPCKLVVVHCLLAPTEN